MAPARDDVSKSAPDVQEEELRTLYEPPEIHETRTVDGLLDIHEEIIGPARPVDINICDFGITTEEKHTRVIRRLPNATVVTDHKHKTWSLRLLRNLPVTVAASVLAAGLIAYFQSERIIEILSIAFD